MTDKEIIKAIEHCKNNEGNGCRGCVFYGNEKGTCIDELLTDAFDLINRQQSEIKRLTTLAKLGNMRADDYRAMRDKCKTARAEAIKEFAERLCEGRVSNDPVVIAAKCLLKEMAGEDK